MVDIDDKHINVGQLRELYNENERIAAVFDYLSERQRNYRETKPETLILRLSEKGTNLERYEMIKFFRDLEDAGCGRYVEGRWGHSSRFEWYVKMSDVGLAAQGVQETIGEFNTDESGLVVDENDLEIAITHEFFLRPDFALKVTLPSDLRASEARRISEWVKTLPFEEVSG